MGIIWFGAPYLAFVMPAQSQSGKPGTPKAWRQRVATYQHALPSQPEACAGRQLYCDWSNRMKKPQAEAHTWGRGSGNMAVWGRCPL